MSYIIANIKMPIEIKKDGSTVPMINRTEIEFTKSNELPPEKENPNAFVIEKLSCFLNLQKEKEKEEQEKEEQQQQQKEEQEEEEEEEEEEQQHQEKTNPDISFSNQFTQVEKEQIVKLFVNKEEIKNNHKKRGQTTTFKRTSNIKNKRKFTEKLRPPITEEDGDADSVQ
jgi:hypothetical protein